MAERKVVESGARRRISRDRVVPLADGRSFDGAVGQAYMDPVAPFRPYPRGRVRVGLLSPQRAGVEGRARKLVRGVFTEDDDIAGRLPGTVLPDGSRDEGVMVAGDDEDRAWSLPEDVGHHPHLRAVDCVVLEKISRDEDELRSVCGRRVDDPPGGGEAFLPDALPRIADLRELHPYLPVGRVHKSNHATPSFLFTGCPSSNTPEP